MRRMEAVVNSGMYLAMAASGHQETIPPIGNSLQMQLETFGYAREP